MLNTPYKPAMQHGNPCAHHLTNIPQHPKAAAVEAAAEAAVATVEEKSFISW